MASSNQGLSDHDASGRAPIAAIAALGVTQIIGYGTLYYSFSILAADMARDLGWPTE
ncbi:MAG: MFS transporter, partial [Mesorhizobium sp.]